MAICKIKSYKKSYAFYNIKKLKKTIHCRDLYTIQLCPFFPICPFNFFYFSPFAFSPNFPSQTQTSDCFLIFIPDSLALLLLRLILLCRDLRRMFCQGGVFRKWGCSKKNFAQSAIFLAPPPPPGG